MGLQRKDFHYVIERLDRVLPPKNEAQGKRAYGSIIPVELRLAVTLRMLRGAKYLDMDWYEVSIWHIWDRIVIPIVKGIIKVLSHNISFDVSNEDYMQELEEQFSYVQVQKYGSILTKGIVGAGDGWLCKTYRPEKSLNLCASDYYNRKSTYGYVVQCFCDAWCR